MTTSHWDIARGAIKRGAAQKRDELAGLVRLLSRRRLATVLEVGTFKGGTLWAWCQLAQPDALVVSVDLPGGEFGGGYTGSERAKIEGYRRDGQRLYLVEGDSHDLAIVGSVERVLAGQPVDFLFVDGDHSYEGVKADWALYSPFVRGLVVFHDVAFHPAHPDCKVDAFWEELRQQYRTGELRDGAGWGGIGYLEWPQ